MDLKSQCCTVEQGKRLVELGVKHEATFWHMPERSHLHGEYIRYGWHSDAIAPAYNVAELGSLLPRDILPDTGFHYGWYHRYCWRGHSVGYSQVGGQQHIEVDWYETEAQARTALLIHLLENKIITI
jgi:hypothetical protein